MRISRVLKILQENLAEQKLNLRKLPWVIQYNKRDLPGILPVSVLNRHLNFMDVPFYESIATSGEGVMEYFDRYLFVDLAAFEEKSR